MTEKEILRYLTLVERRLFILEHSGIDWKPEYGPEMEAIDAEIAELRVLIEQEHAQKEKAREAKQIMNVKDVMAVLAVSESKAYGIIKQLNQELAAKGYITIPGKVSRAYFEEKCYGVCIVE